MVYMYPHTYLSISSCKSVSASLYADSLISLFAASVGLLTAAGRAAGLSRLGARSLAPGLTPPGEVTRWGGCVRSGGAMAGVGAA